MRRSRQLDIGITLLLAFVLFACGASARQKTIRLTYESINVASDQLEAFTRLHGRAIVDEGYGRCGATPQCKEETRAKLDAFLVKTNHASITVVAAYRMVAAAAALNDDRSLATLVQVAALLITELKELGAVK